MCGGPLLKVPLLGDATNSYDTDGRPRNPLPSIICNLPGRLSWRATFTTSNNGCRCSLPLSRPTDFHKTWSKVSLLENLRAISRCHRFTAPSDPASLHRQGSSLHSAVLTHSVHGHVRLEACYAHPNPARSPPSTAVLQRWAAANRDHPDVGQLPAAGSFITPHGELMLSPFSPDTRPSSQREIQKDTHSPLPVIRDKHTFAAAKIVSPRRSSTAFSGSVT